MLQTVTEMTNGVYRVVFLRGSPERVHYSQRRFIVSLLLAIIASAAAQFLYFGDHVVFVILRVFAELTMFMLTMVVLTSRIPRFRLAYLMLILVLISLFADMLLLLLSPLPLGDAHMGIAWLVGGVALYGASSATAWGLKKPIQQGVLVMGVYVLLVLAINVAFRALYDMAAFA